MKLTYFTLLWVLLIVPTLTHGTNKKKKPQRPTTQLLQSPQAKQTPLPQAPKQIDIGQVDLIYFVKQQQAARELKHEANDWKFLTGASATITAIILAGAYCHTHLLICNESTTPSAPIILSTLLSAARSYTLNRRRDRIVQNLVRKYSDEQLKALSYLQSTTDPHVSDEFIKEIRNTRYCLSKQNSRFF